jgi:hypothetical protein
VSNYHFLREHFSHYLKESENGNQQQPPR